MSPEAQNSNNETTEQNKTPSNRTHYVQDSQVLLLKFQLDTDYHYHVNQDTTWIMNVIKEIYEKDAFDQQDMEHILPQSKIDIDLQLKKSFSHDTFQEHLLAQGTLQFTLFTPCARCLIPVKQTYSGQLLGCFVNKRFENDPDYSDSADVFIHDKVWELYFYKEKNVDLHLFVLEQVLLEKESIVYHDPDCKGLCQVCGEDLNKTTCKHK